MSFTGEVKAEVCSLNTIETAKTSESSAIIHNPDITLTSIKVSSENNNVIRHVYTLLKELYGITPKVVVRRGYNYNKKYIYFLEINNNVFNILTDLGILNNNQILITPQDYIYDDDSLTRAYIKGIFLISGSINDPKKSRYHLEILVETEEYANFIKNLLNKYDLNSKV